MTYTFLLFDLDHTLLDFDTAEEVALTQFLQDQGFKISKPLRITTNP